VVVNLVIKKIAGDITGSRFTLVLRVRTTVRVGRRITVVPARSRLFQLY